VNGLADLNGISDERLAQTIVDGGYGEQRISSHIMINGLKVKTLPLSAFPFALFGSGATPSISNRPSRTWCVRPHRTADDCLIPSDVAFAALGKRFKQGALLGPQLKKHEPDGYPAALASMAALGG